MAFKLLGNTDDPIAPIDEMIKGIGFPLVPVEPSTGGGTVTVKQETVLEGASFVDQSPTGLGIALQVEFGAGSTTPEFTLDALGTITCLVADEYGVRLKLSTGRDGQAQVSQIYTRVLINGVQFGNSTHTIIDTSRIEIPQSIEGYLPLQVGDVITFEIIRDTDGNNSGGLTAGNPDVVGWAPSPSAYIQFNRTYAVET